MPILRKIALPSSLPFFLTLALCAQRLVTPITFGAVLSSILATASSTAAGQVNVYSKSIDQLRTGANLNETILTPANVNSTTFGKLYSVPTDGQVYAQPLFVSGLQVGGASHDVVFVATMSNSVYAIDAPTGKVLWQENFGTPVAASELDTSHNIAAVSGIGILGTPVIDPLTKYMYFVTANESQVNGANVYKFFLNSLDAETGNLAHAPVEITATYSTADLLQPLVFTPAKHNQRGGLALANGNVYFAFASHDDHQPYHGWVMAYNATTLQQVAVYSDTTSGGQGGIWNAGGAPNVDAAGNIYLSTGNGSFGVTTNSLVQTGSSFVKLSPQLQLLDYFTPYNAAQLNSGDQDLGSSGMLLIPNTNYLLGGGKQGVVYLCDVNNLGKFSASGDQVRQEFQAVYGKGTSHIHGTPTYFDSNVNGPSIFVWGENDVLRGFQFNVSTGLVTTTPFAKSTMTAPVTNNNGAMPGGFTTISADGKANGIVWASTPFSGDAQFSSTEGVLYAFDANTLQLLWTDKTQETRDEVGLFAKFVQPVVANGKMFIPTFGPLGNTAGTGQLVVYGLLTVSISPTTLSAGTVGVTYSQGLTASGGLAPYSYSLSGSLPPGLTLSGGVLSGTPTTAGQFSFTLTATDSSTGAGPFTGSQAYTLTVGKATPTITWSTPSVIPYGTALSTTQLNAFSPVAGSFNYSPIAGTVLTTGPHTLSVTFTPTDTADYTTAMATVSLTVNKATPNIIWSNPAAITYGTALSSTQLNASASVAGSFVYSPALGTVLSAGSQTLSVTFAPTDAADYTTATATASLMVNKATPTITWSNPAAIIYGTALSATQLNASPSVVSSFSYSPGVGTVLTAGPQTLSVTITPTDTADYTTATATASLTVNKATPTITWANPAAIIYGTALSATQLNASSLIAGSFSYSPVSGTVLTAGPQTLSVTFTPTDTADYTTAAATSSLTVNKATPNITWSNPAAIAYGTPLSPTQLSASASVAGSFIYSPASGTVLTAGPQTLSVTFAPTDTADYTTATATASLTVNKATPSISWSNPAAITYGPALSSAQLNASASVAGSFVYSPASGTVLTAGPNTLSVTFTPTDTADYTTATASVSLTVNKAISAIIWSAPSAITYGTALSGTQLNASSPVAGSFSYSPASGTVLAAGPQTLSVTFNPTDTTDYTTTTASALLTVNKATPTITWSTPAAIAYGTALSSTQLNASASVAGSFIYSPAAGTVLAVGSQTLSVTFTPTNTTDYVTATANVILTVNAVTQTITFASPSSPVTYGVSPITLAATASSGLAVTFSTTGPATVSGNTLTITGAGTVVVTASQAGNNDYNAATPVSRTITVNKAAQTITFAGPSSPVTYGVGPIALSAGASSGLTVTFSVTGPATVSGSILTVTGAGTVVITASQAGNSNYAAASAVSRTLTVNKAKPSNILTASALSIKHKSSITFTATVSGSGSGLVPTGTVTFIDGSTSLGTGTLNGSGVAVYSTTSLNPGTHHITASYGGNTNYLSVTSSAVSITVTP